MPPRPQKHIHVSHTPPTPHIPRTTLIHNTSAALDTMPEPRVPPTCPALTTPHPSPTPALPSTSRTITLSQQTHMQHKQQYTHHSHSNLRIHIGYHDNVTVPTTTAYKWWNCQVFRPANCCQLILPNRFLDGFPDPSQFAAAKLTHYSSKPQRPSDSSRSWQRILLSGDVHPNPGPTTKYPCPVCARNVTSRGVSYLCNRCSGWVHSKCSGLQNAAEYRRIKDWVCSSCNSPPTLPKLQPPPIPTQAVDENSFTIMQFNANGIGNKLTELGEFLKRHNVKVVVIQESKLSSNSKTPSIQNFTTVRKDRRQGQGGGLLTLIHKSINFSRKPESPETLVEPHLEELTITATLGDTELIITNVYIPPASSCTGGYLPSLDHLMMTTDTLILGDFNAHHSAWYSSSTDTRGTLLENVVSGSNFGILNWDSPTRLPGNANPSSPDVSLASASLIHFYQLADEDEPRLRPSTNPH